MLWANLSRVFSTRTSVGLGEKGWGLEMCLLYLFLFCSFFSLIFSVRLLLVCRLLLWMPVLSDAALRLSFIVSHTLFLCWLFLPFHFPVFKKLPIKNFSEGPCSQKPRRWPFLMASCLVQGLQKSEPDHPGVYSPPWWMVHLPLAAFDHFTSSVCRLLFPRLKHRHTFFMLCKKVLLQHFL